MLERANPTICNTTTAAATTTTTADDDDEDFAVVVLERAHPTFTVLGIDDL